MAATKKTAPVKKDTKKITREDIETKIANTLDTIKTQLGDKKFNSLVKKAAKLFMHGIKKHADDKPAKVSVEKPVLPVEKKIKKVAKKVAKKASKKGAKVK